MSTAHDEYSMPSTSQPQPLCYDCRKPLPDGSHFCGNCGRPRSMTPPPRGHRVIDQGKLVSSDVPSWPPPASVLTPLGGVRTSNDLPHPPEPREQGRFHSVSQSRPLDERDSIERLLLHPQRKSSGFTDSLITFKNSGPLGKSPEQMIAEWKARSAPQATPPPAPPQGWITPRALPPVEADPLPDWLAGARPVGPAVEVTPDFLLTSGKSVPLGESGAYRSDPTMKVPRVSKPEGYGPLPGNMQPCQECGGTGRAYTAAGVVRCPANCQNGRIPMAIPQPMPDGVITGSGLTPEEKAMVQQMEAERTGPTQVALEAVSVVPPAQGPQGTGPHRFNITRQERTDLHRHVEDMVEEIAECMTGVATQADNCQGRLTRQRDRLDDLLQRLEYADSEELMVLGMVKDAAEKAITQLRKAETAAREADKCLSLVIMALDVGVIHTTGWQETYGSGKAGD